MSYDGHVEARMHELPEESDGGWMEVRGKIRPSPSNVDEQQQQQQESYGRTWHENVRRPYNNQYNNRNGQPFNSDKRKEQKTGSSNTKDNSRQFPRQNNNNNNKRGGLSQGTTKDEAPVTLLPVRIPKSFPVAKPLDKQWSNLFERPSEVLAVDEVEQINNVKTVEIEQADQQGLESEDLKEVDVDQPVEKCEEETKSEKMEEKKEEKEEEKKEGWMRIERKQRAEKTEQEKQAAEAKKSGKSIQQRTNQNRRQNDAGKGASLKDTRKTNGGQYTKDDRKKDQPRRAQPADATQKKKEEAVVTIKVSKPKVFLPAKEKLEKPWSQLF